MCMNSLTGILPQKFLTSLSNSINFGDYEGENFIRLLYCKSRDKILSNELYYRYFRQKLISVAQFKIKFVKNFGLCAKNEKEIMKILKCA